MAKETVIIFEGEDKFVNKRNKKYDAKRGIAQYVGGDGEVSTDTTTTTTTAAPVNLGSPMPTPDGSADYCSRLEVYIQTRGDRLATGEQIMEAHQYFLTHCNKPVETTTTSSTTTTTTVLPIGTSTTTPTTTLAPTVLIQPTIPIDLGQRPSSTKKTSGGDEEEKSSNSIWLLLLVGLGVLYLFSKDKKD